MSTLPPIGALIHYVTTSKDTTKLARHGFDVPATTHLHAARERQAPIPELRVRFPGSMSADDTPGHLLREFPHGLIHDPHGSPGTWHSRDECRG